MGNLACAKQIIDNGAGLTRAMSCMSTSILLAAAEDIYPTEEQQDRFLKATEEVAKIAAEIEKYVREGGRNDSGERVLGSTSGPFTLGDDPVSIDIDIDPDPTQK